MEGGSETEPLLKGDKGSTPPCNVIGVNDSTPVDIPSLRRSSGILIASVARERNETIHGASLAHACTYSSASGRPQNAVSIEDTEDSCAGTNQCIDYTTTIQVERGIPHADHTHGSGAGNHPSSSMAEEEAFGDHDCPESRSVCRKVDSTPDTTLIAKSTLRPMQINAEVMYPAQSHRRHGDGWEEGSQQNETGNFADNTRTDEGENKQCAAGPHMADLGSRSSPKCDGSPEKIEPQDGSGQDEANPTDDSRVQENDHRVENEIPDAVLFFHSNTIAKSVGITGSVLMFVLMYRHRTVFDVAYSGQPYGTHTPLDAKLIQCVFIPLAFEFLSDAICTFMLAVETNDVIFDVWSKHGAHITACVAVSFLLGFPPIVGGFLALPNVGNCNSTDVCSCAEIYSVWKQYCTSVNASYAI